MLSYSFYENTYLIGVGRDGVIYTFDITTPAIKIPTKNTLKEIDDILSIQPLMARKNQYLLGTNKGLHVAEVLTAPNGKLSFRLCPSDEGDDPHSPFAFYEMRISAAVEYAPDKILLTTRGRTRIYELNLKTRLAVGHMENPSGAVTQFSMIKHPYYDAESYPYIFLKDNKFISIIDIKNRKVLPLVRSQFDMEQLNINNMAIRVMDDLNRSVSQSFNFRNMLKEENKNNQEGGQQE
jgi:hypothetical protein